MARLGRTIHDFLACRRYDPPCHGATRDMGSKRSCPIVRRRQNRELQLLPNYATCGGMRGGWVYIMTNRPNGTLYLGVTSDLARRAWEHRMGLVEGFTKRYGLKRLVYAERHEDIRLAI